MVRSIWTLFKLGIWICFSVALIMWGRQQMQSAGANRYATDITCDEFLSSPHIPGWYRITGCHIDTGQHINEESTQYTSNPTAIASYYIAHGSIPNKKASLIVVLPPDNFNPDMELLGMVEDNGPDATKGGAGTSELATVAKFGEQLTPTWYIMRQGDKPSWNFGIGLFAVGILLCILFTLAFLGVLLNIRQK
jgi:hypothetical protein